MQFPPRDRFAPISARASRESDADIFLISCLFRVGPHCPFIRDIMTGASWVRNVGKLIERGRRISSERASKRANERAKRAHGTDDNKVSLGETFPTSYLRVLAGHARYIR